VLTNRPMLGAIVISVASQLLLIYLPFFNKLFNTSPLSWAEMGLVVAVSSVTFWAIEGQKLLGRRHRALAHSLGANALVPSLPSAAPPALVPA
jgi:magnesium-transporting ATPase (P-type)